MLKIGKGKHSIHADLVIHCLQGVVKALREQGLLPRVIAGSSVGSIGEQLLSPHAFFISVLHRPASDLCPEPICCMLTCEAVLFRCCLMMGLLTWPCTCSGCLCWDKG